MDLYKPRVLVLLAALLFLQPLFCISSAQAQFGAGLLVQTASGVNRSETANISGLYYVTLSHSLKLQNGSFVSSFGGGYQQNYNYEGASTKTVYAADIPEDQSGDWVDPRWSLTRNMTVWGIDKINFGMRGMIGKASLQTRRSSLMANVGPHLDYSERLSRIFSWSQSFDYRYSFFEYTHRSDGKLNSPHAVIVGNTLITHLSGSLTWSFDFTYILTQNFAARNSAVLGLTSEIRWDANRTASMALGVSNESSGLSTSGIQREWNPTDVRNTTVYLNLEFAI